MSNKKFRAGVLYGDEVTELLDYANKHNFAMPAVNVIGTNTINAALECARDVNSPIIIQFSNGGAYFNAGKGLSNEDQKAAIAGGVAGALHVQQMAELYGVPVILHTDHCAKKLLPWIDGLLEASERKFEATGQPLYSSHMIDLSEEPIEENIEISAKYLKRMAKMGMTLVSTARKGLMGIYKTNKTLRMFRLDNLDNINNLLTYFFTINNKTMYNTVKEMFYTPLFDVYTEQRKSIIEQEETDNQPLQFKKLYRYSITKIDFKFANWLCNEGYNGYTAGIMRTFKGVTKDNPFPEEIMLCTPLDDVEIIQENRLKKTNRDKLDDILLYIKNSNIDYKIF